MLAFCAEINRLPSHCDVKSLPENATAHTIPLLSTITPHMLKPRPPFAPVEGVIELVTALLSALQPGRELQFLAVRQGRPGQHT